MTPARLLLSVGVCTAALAAVFACGSSPARTSDAPADWTPEVVADVQLGALAVLPAGWIAGGTDADGKAVLVKGGGFRHILEGSRVQALGARDARLIAAIGAHPAGRAETTAIASLDPKTGAELWRTELPVSGYATVREMVLGPAGETYAVGTFAGKLVAGDIILRADGLYDGFVLALDANGAVRWADRFGGPGGDHASGVAFDPAVGVAVVGGYSGTASFQRAQLASRDDSGDVAVMVYRPDDGALLWVKGLGGPGTETVAGVAIHGSTVAVAATFDGAVVVSGVPRATEGGGEVMLAGLSASGAPAWTRIVAGPGLDLVTGPISVPSGFAIALELERGGRLGELTLPEGTSLLELSLAGEPGASTPVRGTAQLRRGAGGDSPVWMGSARGTTGPAHGASIVLHR